MIDKNVLAQLAGKYLNRVDIKGLDEFNEFGVILDFFQKLQQGEISLNVVGDNPPDSMNPDNNP